jgi:hypothetical protein
MPAIERLVGKLIQSRLYLTSCKEVTTTASNNRINDPHRRNEKETLFRNLSPDIDYL